MTYKLIVEVLIGRGKKNITVVHDGNRAGRRYHWVCCSSVVRSESREIFNDTIW